MREQFTNSGPKDVSVFLKKRSAKKLEELAKLAEQYLNAHGKKLSTKVPVTKHDVKTSLPTTHEDAMRCYVCDWATRRSPLRSGRALDVYSRLSDEQARDYDKLQ